MHCPRKCLKVSNVNFPWFNDVGCVPGISSVVWLCNLRGVFPRFVTLGPSSHPSRRLSTAGGCPGVLRASRRAEEETETGHGIGDGDDQNKVTEKSKQGIAVVRWIDGQMEDPNSITSRASHTHTPENVVRVSGAKLFLVWGHPRSDVELWQRERERAPPLAFSGCVRHSAGRPHLPTVG